jgi:hypothetical protein
MHHFSGEPNKASPKCTPDEAGGQPPAPFRLVKQETAQLAMISAHQFKGHIMTFSMYSASAPVFKQVLNSLAAIINKAEVHAAEKKIDPAALLQARLFPDMFPFTRQVQVAADFAKGAAARLAGVEVPKYEDNEQTFAELKARIAKTVAFIDGLPQDGFEASAQRDITTGSGEKAKQWKGQVYLMHYALPHFFFHATTAYDILRHNGVDIGKKDFIGSF